MTDEETREHLLTSIDDFMDKRIKMADELIMRNLLGLEPHTTAKIVNGDVVLTHARSHVVEEALKYAYSIGIQFRVGKFWQKKQEGETRNIRNVWNVKNGSCI